MMQSMSNSDTQASPIRFRLNDEHEARQVLEVLRTVFLCLMLVGYVFYPLDLWILGHWLESWQSRIPFIVTVPSVLLTVLMLVWHRSNIVRYPFIALMLVNILTGLVGASLHLVYNFEGDLEWTWKGIQNAFEGARPVLAAMAFTHIGVTGLLCSLEPPRQPA